MAAHANRYERYLVDVRTRYGLQILDVTTHPDKAADA